MSGFSGNPNVDLDDRMRTAFYATLDMFDGDVEKARRYLNDKYVRFAEKIEPYFNQYIAEVDAEAKTAELG